MNVFPVMPIPIGVNDVKYLYFSNDWFVVGFEVLRPVTMKIAVFPSCVAMWPERSMLMLMRILLPALYYFLGLSLWLEKFIHGPLEMCGFFVHKFGISKLCSYCDT
jgi:hypothetical protein